MLRYAWGTWNLVKEAFYSCVWLYYLWIVIDQIRHNWNSVNQCNLATIVFLFKLDCSRFRRGRLCTIMWNLVLRIVAIGGIVDEYRYRFLFIISIFCYSWHLRLDPYITVNVTRCNSQTFNCRVEHNWNTVTYNYGGTNLALFAIQDGKSKDFATTTSGLYITNFNESTRTFYLTINGVTDVYNGEIIHCQVVYSTGNRSDMNSAFSHYYLVITLLNQWLKNPSPIITVLYPRCTTGGQICSPLED